MIIGITGGIASGKSTVVSFFKEWGADVIDADKLGWEILENKQQEVIKVFGNEILIKKSSAPHSDKRSGAEEVHPRQNLKYTYRGSRVFKGVTMAIGMPLIDRKKLGKLVFADPKKKRKLDSLIHPPLIKALKKLINSTNLKYLVVDCALIYEWKIEDWFDKIILVTSSYENKLHRLLNLGYNKEEAKNRINAQLSDEVKTADFILTNNSELKILKAKAKKIWNKISTAAYTCHSERSEAK